MNARLLLATLALTFAGCAPPQPAECPCKKGDGAEAHADASHEHEAHAHHAADHECAHPGHEPAPSAAAGSHAVGGSTPPEGHIVPHAGLKTFRNTGASLVGLATPSLGAAEVEVWRSSIAAGARTPVHTHDSEEVFIILAGRGVAHVGDQALPFEAPATLIAPAGVPHWVENTGTEPTDQIVVVRPGSAIKDADGQIMDLPWRK